MIFVGGFLKKKEKHFFRDHCEKSENYVTYWYFNWLMSKS